jgi:hypothetical protein
MAEQNPQQTTNMYAIMQNMLQTYSEYIGILQRVLQHMDEESKTINDSVSNNLNINNNTAIGLCRFMKNDIEKALLHISTVVSVIMTEFMHTDKAHLINTNEFATFMHEINQNIYANPVIQTICQIQQMRNTS